ncbi:MAG: helix-turn-helix domain-containing protein [Alphaproteobacteria bacterium]
MSTADTVTLSRAEYEAMIREIEDAEDLAAVAAAEAREAALGKDVARADYLPVELVKRLFAGEHPIAIWREHRGMTREALAAAANLPPGCVVAIENRQHPGTFDEVARLASALRVSLDDIAMWLDKNTPERAPPDPDARTRSP